MSKFRSSIYEVFPWPETNSWSFGLYSLKYQSVWKHALGWYYMELSKGIPKDNVEDHAKSGNLKAHSFHAVCGRWRMATGTMKRVRIKTPIGRRLREEAKGCN